MKCNNCGIENTNQASFCENCGTQLNSEQPTQQNNFAAQNNQPPQGNFYSQGGYYDAPPPQYMPPPPQQAYYGTPENSKSATPALVLGILSIICGGGIWTILAIVFGIKGMREQKERGLSTTMPLVGLILGIVGGVIGIIMTIFMFPAYLDQLSNMAQLFR